MEQEYIKGDIIMYNNKIHTITDILGVNNYELSYISHPVHQLELSGVPITPEILEKNGWEKVVCRFLYCRKEFETLTFRLFDEDYDWTLRCGNQNLIKKVEFVHELQHFLFGLGINHEMEV